jgi:hypothetical protein
MALNKYYVQRDNTTTIYSLDGLSNIETDLPDFDYKRINLLSDGSHIDGIGIARGRELSADFNFINNNEQEREDFLDYFTLDSRLTLWLYKDIRKRIKNTIFTSGSTNINIPSTTDTSQLSSGNYIIHRAFSTDTIIESIASTNIIASNAASLSISGEEIEFQTFIGRMQVHPMPAGGEVYRNIEISENVEIKLLSSSAYFASTEVTQISITSTTSGEFESTAFNIKGRRTPAKYSFLSSGSTNWNIFQIKAANQYGFKVNTVITSTQTITVKTTNSDLVVDIDDNIKTGVLSSESTPFYLERLNNTLLITASLGTLTISYNERRL